MVPRTPTIIQLIISLMDFLKESDEPQLFTTLLNSLTKSHKQTAPCSPSIQTAKMGRLTKKTGGLKPLPLSDI